MKLTFSLFFIFLVTLVRSQTNNFSIGGNLTTGNLLSYGINIRANLNTNPEKLNQIVFSPSFDYGKISDQSGEFQLRRKEILTVLNYERTKNRFKFYVYNEFEKSFLRKIRIRGAFGTGLSYRIVENETTNFDVSQLILPEFFQSSFTNKRDNWALRLSTRIRLSKKFPKYKYSSQLLFQPAVYTELTDGTEVSPKNNTTVRINNSYEFVLSKNLSIGFMGEMIVQTYTSYINPTVKPYDTNLNLFIKGNF